MAWWRPADWGGQTIVLSQQINTRAWPLASTYYGTGLTRECSALASVLALAPPPVNAPLSAPAPASAFAPAPASDSTPAGR